MKSLMHFITVIIIFLTFQPLNVAGQFESAIQRKILNADTVLLVSHSQTHGIAMFDSVTEKTTHLDKLVHNERLNYKVIEQMKRLPDSLKWKLISIFHIPNTDTTIDAAQFIPMHAILLITKGKIETWEVDFGSSSLSLGKVRRFGQTVYLGENRNKALEAFFKYLQIFTE